MGKITDYPKVTELVSSNVLLLDGENGTKGILAEDLAKGLMSLMTTKEIMANINISELDGTTSVDGNTLLPINTTTGNKKISVTDAVWTMLDATVPIEIRRNLWRGKKLGSSVTSDQYNEIASGTFKNLFLGDYWEIGGRIWRIMDFDYWYGLGDVVCTVHHLVIMPDYALYDSTMNDSDVTTGAYVGSKMYTNNINNAKTIVNGAFGSTHILNHREYLTNAVTGGVATAGAWFDSTVELPNELMIYGCYIQFPANNGTVIPSRYATSPGQLSGFLVSRGYARIGVGSYRNNYWLREVVSSNLFGIVSYTGGPGANQPSKTAGVRVVFGLRKAA